MIFAIGMLGGLFSSAARTANAIAARQCVEEMKKVPSLLYVGDGWLALNLAGP